MKSIVGLLKRLEIILLSLETIHVFFSLFDIITESFFHLVILCPVDFVLQSFVCLLNDRSDTLRVEVSNRALLLENVSVVNQIAFTEWTLNSCAFFPVLVNCELIRTHVFKEVF